MIEKSRFQVSENQDSMNQRIQNIRIMTVSDKCRFWTEMVVSQDRLRQMSILNTKEATIRDLGINGSKNRPKQISHQISAFQSSIKELRTTKPRINEARIK